MAKSARTIFQLGALVLLLIVFPAASWYYLNSGLQYRRSTMAELKEYGNFPSENWTLVDGSQLSKTFLSKKMLLAHFMPDSDHPELLTQYGETLRRLYDQFEERNELVFLTLLHGDTATTRRRTGTFVENYELEDPEQVFFVQLDDQKFSELKKGALLPKSDAETELMNPESAAYFLLTDTTATIRRYYDIREESDIKRLVEHIALLLPFKKDRDLIFKREVEK